MPADMTTQHALTIELPASILALLSLIKSNPECQPAAENQDIFTDDSSKKVVSLLEAVVDLCVLQFPRLTEGEWRALLEATCVADPDAWSVSRVASIAHDLVQADYSYNDKPMATMVYRTKGGSVTTETFSCFEERSLTSHGLSLDHKLFRLAMPDVFSCMEAGNAILDAKQA